MRALLTSFLESDIDLIASIYVNPKVTKKVKEQKTQKMLKYTQPQKG